MNRWVRVMFLRLLVLPTIGALLVGVGLRYWFGIQDPQVTIPTPTMPTPNGFDLLKTAGEKVRADRDTITELTSNGQAFYTSQGWQKAREEKPLSAAERARILTERQAKIAQLLRRHSDTLTLTRKALTMPCQMPSLRSWNDLCPYYDDFRSLAKLMVLGGELAKANGAKPDDIAQKYLDVIRLGEKISHGGPIIGRLVSIAVTTIGQNALAPLATEVTPVMARIVIKELEQYQNNRGAFAETMTEEKYGMQASLLELYQHPDRFINETADEQYGCDESQRIRMLPLAYLIWGKRTMFENVTRQMDQTIEQAKQSYRAEAPEIQPADDPISQYVFPVFSQARLKDVLVQTQNELLIAQFATEAYRAEKGIEPGSLADLTKAGYPTPEDPFADGKPLIYHAIRGMSANGVCSTDYGWHSVGPDRQNDGGKPCENTRPQTSSKQKYQVNSDSKGDIVPGVNVFAVRSSQNAQ